MKKTLLAVTAVALLFFIYNDTQAQRAFIKNLETSSNGYDEPFDVVETPSKDLYAFGYSPQNANYKTDLIRADSAGNLIDTLLYGTSSDNGAYRVISTYDGGYAIAGYTNIGSGYQMMAIKLDKNLNLTWEKTFSDAPYSSWKGTPVYDMTQTADSSLYMVGGYYVAGQDDSAYVIKMDASGNVMWDSLYTTTQANHEVVAFAVDNAPGGGIIVTGKDRNKTSGDNNVWLLRLSATGAKQWEQSIGTIANNEMGYALYASSNSYLIAGFQGPDAYIVETDLNGNMNWSNQYSATGATSNEFYSIYPTMDGGYFATGFTDVNANDFYAVKTDASGNLDWQNNYGFQNSDKALAGRPTSDGGFVLTGYVTDTSSAFWDSYLVKTDAAGNVCDNFPVLNVMTDTVPVGSSTTFTPYMKTGTGTGNLSFQWSGQDGFSSTDSVATWSYSAPGVYTYEVQVTDGNGCVGMYAGKVKVDSFMPCVSNPPQIISCNADTVILGDSTYFTLQVQGGAQPYLFNWSGDDGFSDFDSMASWQYSSGGNFSFQVIVTDTNGCQDTCTNTTYVKDTTSSIFDHTQVQKTVAVYPNPVEDQIYLYPKKSIQVPVKVELQNLLGQTLYSRSFERLTTKQSLQLPADLQKGVYFLHVEHSGQQMTRKLVKY